MTPKLKAIELLEKFIYRTKDYVEIEDAKACAIIAVDEILDKDGYNNDYWHEVKQEIINL